MRKQVSEEILGFYEAENPFFLDRLVIQDESWVPRFDPESKAESRDTSKETTTVISSKIVRISTISREDRLHHLLGCPRNPIGRLT